MSRTQWHHSPNAVDQRASTGSAIRRGELKISDPIPIASAHLSAATQENPPFERTHSRKAGTWSGGLSHGRSVSASPLVTDEVGRNSSGPVSMQSPPSSTPLKSSVSKKRETGLRATLKRMLSSRRGSAGKLSQSAARYASTEHLAGAVQTPPSATTSPLTSPLRQHSLPINLSPLQESAQDTSFVVSPLPKVEEEIRAPSRRRNTIPSLAMSNDDSASASQHVSARESLNRPSTAIRHPDRGNIQLKRKSKSADDIPDLSLTFNTNDPDRQDRMSEIAFWRNTVIANPLPVWNNTERHSDRPEAVNKHDHSVLVESKIPSIEPVQDFDFGLEDSSVSTGTVSLDERVNTLEVKMIDFEYALAKLQGNDLPRPMFRYKPSRQPHVQDEYLQRNTSSNASPTSVDRSLTRSSPRKDGLSFADGVESPDRTSKATIKPTPRQSSFERQDAKTTSLIRASQYEALLKLVHNEQSARQVLEMQVLTLRKEMEALQRPIQSAFRPHTELTPSPDSFYNSSVLPRNTLSQHSPPLYGSSPFQETSRFSMTESDLETETDDYPEVFETPQESRFPDDSRDEPFSFGMI